MDIGASNWDEDDNGNATAAPDGAPEGMAPSGVNNVLRAHQGAIKRWYNWSSPRTTGGTSTAYTLSYGVAPGALLDGMSHVVQFHAANGNAATLSVNALGAIPLHYYSAGAWRAVPTGLWGSDNVFRVAYHGSSGAYRILGRPDTTGDLVPTARSSARTGTLLCFGQAISRSQYAGLFAALGTTYGAGDGSTTFNLPDLRGVVPAGKADMGGSNRGNLSGGTVLGAAIGDDTHTLTSSEQASMTVTGTFNGTADSTVSAIASGAATGSLTSGVNLVYDRIPAVSGAINGTAFGGGGPHNNVQPTIIANYAICL